MNLQFFSLAHACYIHYTTILERLTLNSSLGLIQGSQLFQKFEVGAFEKSGHKNQLTLTALPSLPNTKQPRQACFSTQQERKCGTNYFLKKSAHRGTPRWGPQQ